MLTTVGTPTQIQGAKGQYLKTCCQFKSDTDLTNEIIRVKIGLFTNGVPNNTAFTWQSSYISGGMTFISPNIAFQNHDVTIQVIDNFNYRVCVEFIASEDCQGFSDDNGVGVYNSNFITGNGPAYTGGSSIAIHSQIGTDASESATCYTPVQLTDFCELNYTLEDVNGNEVTGYSAGEDLNVKFGVSGDTSATFYAGFYDETGIADNQGLVIDLGLSYAQMAGSNVNQVGNLPTTCLKSSIPINSNGVDSEGCFTIDGSCLNSGCYRAYIVYRQDGKWISCVTEQICLRGATTPKIDPDFTGSITQGSQTTSRFCVYGLNSCIPVALCIDFDVAAYDAILITNGLTGTATDYLESFLLDVEGVNIPISVNGTNTGGCANYSAPEGFSGIIQGAFTYTFDFGSHKDVISKAFEFNFVNQELINTGTFTANGNDITDVLCAEEGNDIDFDLGLTGTCVNFLELGGRVLEQLSGSTVTAEQMAIDAQYCIKSICEVSVQESDCECPPCGNLSIDVVVTDESTSDFYEVAINNVNQGCTLEALYQGGTQTGNNLTFDVPKEPALPRAHGISIMLNCDNGCLSSFAYGFARILNNDGLETLTLFGTGNEVNCECPQDFECGDQFISILATCDEDTGTITAQDDISSIIDTIESDSGLEQSTDQITWIPAAASVTGEIRVYYRRVIVTENCGIIQAFETATCQTLINCLNNREISHVVNSNCELILTINDSFSSAIIQDRLCVTINGTKTTFDHASSYAPITLEHGDVVSYESSTIVDGCPDVIVEAVGFTVDKTQVGGNDCDFDGYSLSCQVDPETKSFVVQFTGDPTVLGENGIYPQYSNNGTTGSIMTSPMVFQGQGLMQLSWVLERDGCTKILSPLPCYIKPQVEICNIEDFNCVGDIVVVNNNCCGCECSFTASCDGCILTINVNNGCEGTFTVTGPGGYIGTGLVHDLENFPSGDYTITFAFDSADCEDLTQVYTYDKAENPNVIDQGPIQ